VKNLCFDSKSKIKSNEWEIKVSQNPELPEPEPLSQEEKTKNLAQAKINVPIKEKYQYADLLCKHYDVFRKDKQDLGKALNFEFKIKLKEDNRIKVKQFPMPEVHRDKQKSQIKEWQKRVIFNQANQDTTVGYSWC
jgi:hypothetical protein